MSCVLLNITANPVWYFRSILFLQVKLEDRHRVLKKRHKTAWSIKSWTLKALDMFAAVSFVLDGICPRLCLCPDCMFDRARVSHFVRSLALAWPLRGVLISLISMVDRHQTAICNCQLSLANSVDCPHDGISG